MIWSLANEEYFYQGTPTGARIVSTMKALAKKLDPTRPVTGAMNGGWGSEENVHSPRRAKGFNRWNGGMPDEMRAGGPGLPVYTDIDNCPSSSPSCLAWVQETTNGNGTRGIYEDDPKRGTSVHMSSSPPLQVTPETWWKLFE